LTTDLLEIPVASTGPPPGSLTGALCTGVTELAVVSVDWFSCTWPIPDGEAVDWHVENLLLQLAYLIDDQEPLDYGKFGYSRIIRLNGSALLMFNPERSDMGVHLEIPASGFRSFLGPEDTVESLIDLLVNQLGGRPTRIDVAYDDYAGLLDIEAIDEYFARGAFVCRWRTGRREYEFRCSDQEPRGRIVRLGKRQSEAYGRIYDKRLEQVAKGKTVEHEYWHRVEIEFKGAKAPAVAQLVLREDAPEQLRGLLYGYLDFKEVDAEDSNKRRWPTSSWWLTFLDNVGKVHLCLPKPSESVEKTGEWLEAQIAPSIALMAVAMGAGDVAAGMAYIRELVDDGIARFRKRHERMLLEYRRQHG